MERAEWVEPIEQMERLERMEQKTLIPLAIGKFNSRKFTTKSEAPQFFACT